MIIIRLHIDWMPRIMEQCVISRFLAVRSSSFFATFCAEVNTVSLVLTLYCNEVYDDIVGTCNNFVVDDFNNGNSRK